MGQHRLPHNYCPLIVAAFCPVDLDFGLSRHWGWIPPETERHRKLRHSLVSHDFHNYRFLLLGGDPK